MTCGHVILQLGDLLFWRDAIIFKRRPFYAGTLLLIPIVISSLCISMHVTRLTKGEVQTQRKIIDKKYEMLRFLPAIRGKVFGGKLAYSPDTNLTRQIMENVRQDISQWFNLVPFDDENSLESTLTERAATKDHLAGIVFSSLDHPTVMPKNIEYKIRMYPNDKVSWATHMLYDNSARLHIRPSINNVYYTEGFLMLQVAIEKAILKIMCVDDDANYTLTVNRMRSPQLKTDGFYAYIAVLQPILIMCSFLVYCIAITREVVHDKELKIKEKLNMMGVSNFIIWVAYFLKYFLFLFLTFTVISVMMLTNLSDYGPLLGHTDALLVLTLMLLYFIASLNFTFAISTLFSVTTTAAYSAFMIFATSFTPSIIMIFNPAATSAGVKAFLCLLPNVALYAGFEVMVQRLEVYSYLSWRNVSEPVFTNQLAFSTILLLLVFDTVFYGIFAWYLENVQPTSGIPKPLYFPFMKTYWLGKKPSREYTLQPSDIGALFESNPPGLRIGMQLKRISKVFGEGSDETAAVNDMDMDMMEGQITVMLGPHESGKSTIVSLLTGLTKATGGTAFVDGYDISKDVASVHSTIGVCPQDNIFFGFLTVEENLRFFGRLKGVTYRKLKGEVSKMLVSCGLKRSKDALAKDLSIAHMRLLTVAQALMGSPSIVILDEPTKEMDPTTRHHVWSLLKKYKAGRTTFVTTSFEDEAEHLGDRIAIIANGTLQCCGSAQFLKKRYSAGYHLIITKTEKCRVDNVTTYVQKHMPNACLEKCVANEMVFSMPEEDSAMFVDLFKDLEDAQHEIGVLGYSVCISSLEEMYFRVVEEEEMDVKQLLMKKAEVSQFKQRLSRVLSTGRRMTKFFEVNVQNEAAAAQRRGSRRMTLVNADTSSAASTAYTRKKTIVEVKFDSSKAPTAPVATIEEVIARLPNENKTENCNNVTVSSTTNQNANPDTSDSNPTQSTVARSNASIPAKHAQSEASTAVSTDSGTVGQAESTQDIVGSTNNKQAPVTTDTSQAQPSEDNMVGVQPIPRSSLTGETNLDDMLFDEKQTSSKLKITIPSRQSIKLQVKHVKVLLQKMALHSIRNVASTFLRFIIPVSLGVFFVVASSLISQQAGIQQATTALPLTLSQYEEPLATYHTVGKLGDTYGEGFASQFPKTVTVKNLSLQGMTYTEYFTRKAMENRWKFFRNFLIAASFEDIKGKLRINASFNTEPYHLEPIAFNVIHNAILKGVLGDYGIQVTNHPISVDTKEVKTRTVGFQLLVFMVCYTLMVATIVPALYSVFRIRENVTMSKHMQILTGVRPFTYWLSAFLWDYFTYLCAIGVLGTIFATIDSPEYGGGRLIPLMTAFVMFGWAVLPFVYLLSFAFDKPTTGIELLVIMFGVMSMVPLSLIVACRKYITDEAFTDFLATVFEMFMPHYVLGTIIWDMKFKHELNYFAWDSVGRHLFFLFFNGFLYWFFIALTEMLRKEPSVSKILRTLACEAKPQVVLTALPDEEDVTNETSRVANKDSFADEAITFCDVSKCYGSKVAVDRLSFGVPNGTCFGLLGMNRTGKTTIFKLLTGQTHPTSGDIYIKGFDLKLDGYGARRYLGYCPETNTFLLCWMTGLEALRFYGRLRGISEGQLKAACDSLTSSLGLDVFCNEQINKYTRARKHLLAIAIALIGDPPIILLDNPTGGLDPVSKQKVREVLNSRRSTGATIILASHSMAECEELCSLIAILAEGQFQCFGSVARLMAKYGKGCSVVMRLKEIEEDNIASDRPTRDFMSKNFPGSRLIDTDKERLTFQVKDPGMNWAQIHTVIEKAKTDILIESFYVIQATLAQMFMSFAFHRKGNK